MCHADITFVLALIALSAGALLVLFAKAHKEIPTRPCIVIGYVVVGLSIIIILFSGYKMLRSCTSKCQMKSNNSTQMIKKPVMQIMKSNVKGR